MKCLRCYSNDSGKADICLQCAESSIGQRVQFNYVDTITWQMRGLYGAVVRYEKPFLNICGKEIEPCLVIELDTAIHGGSYKFTRVELRNIETISFKGLKR